MTAATPPGPGDWLGELTALREAATPGPWDTYSGNCIGAGAERFSYLGETASEDDAALIVAAVNALPALVGALRAVEALADELEREAPTREPWDGNEQQAFRDAADRIRAALAAVRRDGAGT